ncbi:MAG: hypothetical protein KBA03_07070 [Anaerolineaceae bacterium]|nr:hypothetical protein [Anaerolineaceae bacterium]
MEKTIKRIPIISLLIGAVLIFGMAYLLSACQTSAQVGDDIPTVEESMDGSQDKRLDQVDEAQIRRFTDKLVNASDVNVEILSINLNGNDAIVKTKWDLKGFRSWKISKARLEIDGLEYAFGGYDLAEGLFHYIDGDACKITASESLEPNETCSADLTNEKPYRLDLLIFKDVPHDFLDREVVLTITEMSSVPNESEYCKDLQIERIAEVMQKDYPGIELYCFQEPGFNGYSIREGSSYANDEAAKQAVSDRVVSVISGNTAGIWKFDLSKYTN